MVAQRSQKDPKEYLPYLSELQKMEPFYQKYTIDTHLGRHAKALRNLSQAGEQYFDLCLEIMQGRFRGNIKF
jgi:elongator complex protein 1